MTDIVKEMVLMACEQILSCSLKNREIVVKLYVGNDVEYYVLPDIAEELVHSTSGQVSCSNLLKDMGSLHRDLARFSDMQRQYNTYLGNRVGLRFSKEIESDVDMIFKRETTMFCYEVTL
ncbi:MAG: hypothetical protein IJE43_19615 [Alphaproteobacteria bacterium]|nr:hypothetical protein [Alphaproteobacteria bacterium]